MAKSTYLSIITLKVNRLNVLIKRLKVSDWIKKKNTPRTYNMLPTRDSLEGERHTQTESEGIEKDISFKGK